MPDNRFDASARNEFSHGSRQCSAPRRVMPVVRLQSILRLTLMAKGSGLAVDQEPQRQESILPSKHRWTLPQSQIRHAKHGKPVGSLLDLSLSRPTTNEESIMIRASWITLLATVVLLSLPVDAQNGSKVWWPQFRGPNSSGLGGGKTPVHFGPDQMFVGRLRWGLDCRRPSFGKGVFF